MTTYITEQVVISNPIRDIEKFMQEVHDCQGMTYIDPIEYEYTIQFPLPVLIDPAYLHVRPPYEQPPYVCRLHPRRDYQRRPYWLRIRSNPHRRNYH